MTTIAVGMLHPVTSASGNGAGEDPDRVAQEAGHEKDDRGEPPGPDAEARLEPGVGGLLVARGSIPGGARRATPIRPTR